MKTQNSLPRVARRHSLGCHGNPVVANELCGVDSAITYLIGVNESEDTGNQLDEDNNSKNNGVLRDKGD